MAAADSDRTYTSVGNADAEPILARLEALLRQLLEHQADTPAQLWPDWLSSLRELLSTVPQANSGGHPVLPPFDGALGQLLGWRGDSGSTSSHSTNSNGSTPSGDGLPLSGLLGQLLNSPAPSRPPQILLPIGGLLADLVGSAGSTAFPEAPEQDATVADLFADWPIIARLGNETAGLVAGNYGSYGSTANASAALEASMLANGFASNSSNHSIDSLVSAMAGFGAAFGAAVTEARGGAVETAIPELTASAGEAFGRASYG